MSAKKRTTLKFKFALFSSSLVVLIAVIMSTYIRTAQKLALLAEMENSRVETTKAVRQVAREAIITNTDTGMVDYFNNVLKKAGDTILYAMVLHPDGRVRVHTEALLIGKKLEDPLTKAAIDHRNRDTPLIQSLTTETGQTALDYTLPVLLNQELEGFVRVGFDKKVMDAKLEASLKDSDRRILQAFLLALGLGLVGAITLAALITRPINTLRIGAERIGQGKLDSRIQVKTNDELEELADEFNLMAQKLGELDQMKQDFVSNVTHELRSPLTSIKGYMDLLMQEAAGKLTDLQRDYLSIIKNSAVRLSRFIDNLLDVAKIEAHKLVLTPAATDLHQLAHEMEVLFKPQLEEKKITFTNKIPNNTSPAFVDKDKIAEVLINLVSNAVKFTPDHGTISLAAQEAPAYVEVHVEDSGVGIPKEMIVKIFSKFEQVKSDQGLARKQKGTGLGLAIVKGIIEAHGGRIQVESPASSGKGSAFKFTIPKMKA
ncbi:MAG: HAMP domain-containing histidine kinase [Elusimicrobia bacterium]|nr:HAMP domain-containing histidine kinase [Candidatus Obscuribacterium magneticum]